MQMEQESLRCGNPRRDAGSRRNGSTASGRGKPLQDQDPSAGANRPLPTNGDRLGRRDSGFWLALEETATEARLVGTIAMIDFGAGKSALRKMFVRADRRGPAYGVSAALLETALTWCVEAGIRDVYLGTVSILEAAHRFYEKNDFAAIPKADLPAGFPVMAVDTHFYHRRLAL